MSVLSVLGGAAKIAGAGFNAYGDEKELGVKNALAQTKARDDAERNRVLNLIGMTGIDPAAQGKIEGAKAMARVPAAVEETRLKSPIEVMKARDTAAATAPITQATHAANTDYNNAHQPPVKDSYTPVVTTAAGGDQHVSTLNTKTGTLTDTGQGAKMGSSAAKLTGDQEKSYLFYNLMKNSEPEITAALGTGQIRPSAVSAYLAAGAVGDIPLIGKAVGAFAKPTANANLTEEEQKLIRAGKDFTAGVLRKESGAAVTNSELMETMERYFPGMFGDKPGLTAAKALARSQYMKTMEQEAGPAIDFYTRRQHTGEAAGGKSQAKPTTGDPDLDAILAKYPKKPPV